MSETVFVYVDSREAEPGGVTNSFQIQLPEPIVFHSEHTRLRVDNVRLVNSFRTVSPSNCNIYVQEGSSVRCCTLDFGWYSALTVGAKIASALGSPYHIDYNEANNTLTISKPSDFVILSDSQLLHLSVWPGPSGTNRSNPCSFNNILQNGTGAIATSNTYVVPFLPISPYDFVYLRSYRLASSRSISKRGEHDILCRIDVNEAFGSILTGGTPLQEALVIGQGTYQNLDFFVTDRLGNPVYLDQGSLTFQLTFFI